MPASEFLAQPATGSFRRKRTSASSIPWISLGIGEGQQCVFKRRSSPQSNSRLLVGFRPEQPPGLRWNDWQSFNWNGWLNWTGIRSLQVGTVGVVVFVHADGEAYEVEFLTPDARTIGVETVPAGALVAMD
ncbi:MAG: DUF4926 domain-containing protein [Burkholderiales bacterium]|jgi:hypothetical protein|nr:DUF4926 domain-containing protein [Burkholderiales bacterium]